MVSAPRRDVLRPRLPKLAACLLAALLAACGGDDDGGGTASGTPGGGSPFAAAGGDAELDKGDVRDYLKAFEALQEKGMEYDAKYGDDPSKISAAGAAWAWNDAWREILGDHGFDEQTFTQTHLRVAMAFSALMMDEQLAVSKAQMPPEQYEMMKQMMSANSPFGGVSDDDKALVKGMLSEIKAAYGMQD